MFDGWRKNIWGGVGEVGQYLMVLSAYSWFCLYSGISTSCAQGTIHDIEIELGLLYARQKALPYTNSTSERGGDGEESYLSI